MTAGNHHNIPDLSALTPPTTNRSLADNLAAWVSTASAGPDQISWDVALTFIPTPQGQQPGYMVLLRMPSPVLGEQLHHIVLLGLDGVAQPVVIAQVRDAVERLRAQRSELLASTTNGSRG